MSKWSGEVYCESSGDWAFKLISNGKEMPGGFGYKSKKEAESDCNQTIAQLHATFDRTPFRRDEQGRYAWDLWKERAATAEVEKELVQLGRDLMREAVQHDWSQQLKAECGWEDDGEKMLQLALQEPYRARNRWRFLLDTDGNRGRWEDKTGDWL